MGVNAQYMLDTNICIYILKKHPDSVLKKFQTFDDIHISAIVYSELQYGIELSPKKTKQIRFNQLLDFLSLLTIDTWDQNAADSYARLRACLKSKGNIIGNMDMLIAAHALSTNSVLISNNTREFERIPELKLENWTI